MYVMALDGKFHENNKIGSLGNFLRKKKPSKVKLIIFWIAVWFQEFRKDRVLFCTLKNGLAIHNILHFN